MAPLPKRRNSTSRSGKRMAKEALSEATIIVCPNCGAYKRPHRVCPSCNTYAARKSA